MSSRRLQLHELDNDTKCHVLRYIPRNNAKSISSQLAIPSDRLVEEISEIDPSFNLAIHLAQLREMKKEEMRLRSTLAWKIFQVIYPEVDLPDWSKRKLSIDRRSCLIEDRGSIIYIQSRSPSFNSTMIEIFNDSYQVLNCHIENTEHGYISKQDITLIQDFAKIHDLLGPPRRYENITSYTSI